VSPEDSNPQETPVVTIDGPGGSGKGTVAWRLAQHLGWHFLDSGALYRLVAFASRKHAVSVASETAVARVAQTLDVEFAVAGDAVSMLLEGSDVSDGIRSNDISKMSSVIAAIPAVRAALVARQRAFRQAPGLVADGRDMGTVIFPDARLKIFLTASAEERAKRRYKQLKEKGESVNLSRLFREIKTRDERDRSRSVAPLRPADDAIIVDSTDLNIKEVVKRVYKLVEERYIIN
jgi:cytidylate kinase